MSAPILNTYLVVIDPLVVNNDELKVEPSPWCARLISFLSSAVSPKAIQHLVLVVSVIEHNKGYLARVCCSSSPVHCVANGDTTPECSVHGLGA